ncbi:MAG: atpH [Desulfacinum sp.]|nr:atpH [Desulfacinum sp.]
MKNLIVAKRYAKALFGLALEDGKLEEYGKELSDLTQLLEQNPDLMDALANPLYPEDAKKAVFRAIAEKAEMSAVMKSFGDLLVAKDRVRHLPEIRDYFQKLVDDHNNVARARVSAAVKLDENSVKKIADTLSKVTGKKVVVEFQQDPGLIGGVVAQIGDLVIDGSVRSQLQAIKESLKRGELG